MRSRGEKRKLHGSCGRMFGRSIELILPGSAMFGMVERRG